MPEIQKLFSLSPKPGIQRDGTTLDSSSWSEGQHVRFQRGRPKSMGGYVRTTPNLQGPVRDTLVWSRGQINNIFTFSGFGIECVQVDSSGGGAAIIDLTPSGYTTSDNLLWSTDTIYDSAVGSTKSIILAVPTNTVTDITDQTEYTVYYGDAYTPTQFTAISDVSAVASGGLFVTGPYAVLYGTDGKVTWSNANEPQNYTTGDAGSARVTGAKLVKGIPVRSGSGPGGILWSLDSVLRMDYVQGSAIFKFTTLSSMSSILAQNSVIEYDNNYYWIGIDRFLATDGNSVQELPNSANLNWFFDNLNYAQRQKIWAMKVPRFGEIWWFYPRGTATECNAAVIYNVREKIWYDTELSRSSGYYSQVFQYPVMTKSTENDNIRLDLTGISGSFSVNDTILDDTTNATGIIYEIIGGTYRVYLETGSGFTGGGTITNLTTSGAATIDAMYLQYSLYVHEVGYDDIEGEVVKAIDSHITSNDFGFVTGGISDDPVGLNRWTRLVRIEPDFIQTGSLAVSVIGKEFANSSEVVDGPHEFTSSTEKIDLRTQYRNVSVKIQTIGYASSFEMGKVLLHVEPGDVRS